ncbi:WecB/TagA/CpsF family glycosyltransferase [Pseudophaeobacter sp.]|uniref:WecB/TagA/CpsF family glycosyltransferase n=1 Tax=Rhodobacterales TaxID=204455 RepID=UPI0032976D2F
MMIWSEASSDQPPVTVTVPDRETLFSDLTARLKQRDGFSVATLNLDHVVKLARNPAFHAAYVRHTHVTADGHPIVWLSRLAGQRDISLIPGSELVEPLAGIAARLEVGVALVGATHAALTAAAESLRVQHPGLKIVLEHAPAMGFDPKGPAADAAIAEIRGSGAGLVFLALGAPRQEQFASRAQDLLPNVGFLSIGAGLDFLAGMQTRAPRWIQAVAAEWLWRMVSSPGRLGRRYGACLAALPRLTLRAAIMRRRAGT